LKGLWPVVSRDEHRSGSTVDEIEPWVGEQLGHDHTSRAIAEPLIEQRRQRRVDDVDVTAEHDDRPWCQGIVRLSLDVEA